MSGNPGRAWSCVQGHLDQWYHAIDHEALLITLCANCSHFYTGEKPVWILCLGTSGSGKTDVLIEASRGLPGARVIGDITPAAFLSSWGKGTKEKNNLLPPNGGTAIWLAKDFTTLSTGRSESLVEVGKRLREVWDGEFMRDTGKGPTLEWRGKVSLLAVATPAIEDAWGALRSIGERFLYVRWRSSTDTAERKLVMGKARSQLGYSEEIHSRLHALCGELCELSGFWDAGTPPGDVLGALDETADLVSVLRVSVRRDSSLASRPIVEVGEPELPTRISAGLSQIMRTHQGMFHKPPITDSLALAHRVALDTIPRVRRLVLSMLPLNGAPRTWMQLAETYLVPGATLQRTLEDLMEMGVLDRNCGDDKDWSNRVASYDKKFLSRVVASGIKF